MGICIHFFTFEFLERVVMLNEDSLQHHVAKKKIPFVDASGSIVKPEKPNGIKMEKFVFDVFQFAKNFVVWECLRDNNNDPDNNNDEKGYVVMAEISPLVSYAGENLEGYKGKSLQLPLSIN